jgi:hypothetical protein
MKAILKRSQPAKKRYVPIDCQNYAAIVIESKDLTSANRLEHGRSDESNDEVAKRG